MSSRNNEGKIVIVLIVSLIAFGLGSGIGITVGISQENPTIKDNETLSEPINVTHNITKYNSNYNASLDSEEDLNNSDFAQNSGEYYPENDSNQTNIEIV